jgi:hypothetical protein
MSNIWLINCNNKKKNLKCQSEILFKYDRKMVLFLWDSRYFTRLHLQISSIQIGA